MKSARWMLVVCDTFSWEDYPVFTYTVEDFDNRYAHYISAEMQRIMEVYDLDEDIDAQLDERRVWNFPLFSKHNPNEVKTKTIEFRDENSLLDWIDKK